MADRGRPRTERNDASEGFLRRWSRRKVEARSTAAAATHSSEAAEPATASLEQTTDSDQGGAAPVDPKDLPDIETLDANSDFTVFMRPGVPEHLRTLALRKLWRSDPIFSKLDGLVEYGEDYTIASWPKGTIRTAYQIGRGFVNKLEKLAGADRADQAPPSEPAVEPADQAARIAAAPSELPPPEPANPREPSAPHQRPARPAPRRRRDSPGGS